MSVASPTEMPAAEFGLMLLARPLSVLVVQFGAGQCSPRLVRVFRRDPAISVALATTPVTGSIVHCAEDAVLAALDVARLVALARDAGAVIEVSAQIGSHIPRGASLLQIRGGGPIDPGELRRAFVFADGRRLTSDPAFANRCIVDVTIRALSAAFDDPTSAVEGLDALDAVLQRLGRAATQAAAILDQDGAVRLLVPVTSWDEQLDLALTEIRWYGAEAPQGTRRLAALLDGLESSLPSDRVGARARHRLLLAADLQRIYRDPGERAFAGTPDRLRIAGSAPTICTHEES